MLEPIESSLLAALPGIRHGFFTRRGGVSNGIYAELNCGPGSADDPAAVAENRARVAQHLLRRTAGSPEGSRAPLKDVATLYQIHSGDAVAIDSYPAPDNRPKADGVVTATPGLVIGVLTADCGPVLFADAEAKVVGAAHAGWRGAVGGVLAATVAQMEKLGARRERIIAAVGPCINQDAYEVGPDFEATLLKSCADNSRFLARAEPNSKAHFDLPGFVVSQLDKLGLAQIERQSPCTYVNESQFFSFRRSQHRSEGDYGRQISAIVVT
ncbi:peptidoglycan editing factor PgeF [Hyphomicrobium sulfonivorans]|uniref:peptidoglycan editing factor PgeF n=1 Tax=Hyphomicrobium sulfonivorans TaxID=121290 RepID=UPI00156FADBB|nr:peptidoglycan editing factor PgeF [Hyphomicrobium sulfonivorans]MBI1649946.1 peptidoglycan editing factor PgeF [Hyphomicrobium sulfonivorans]NSL72863.1 peptidoglycan editing factor PgeF [Hyphomicrobium sulfonivorans]